MADFDLSLLKPFNRQRAEAGDPVYTRCGLTVLQIKIFDLHENADNLFAVIRTDEGNTFIKSYNCDGRRDVVRQSDYDLLMGPVEKTWYFASWSPLDAEVRNTTSMYHTYQMADELAKAIWGQGYKIHEFKIIE